MADRTIPVSNEIKLFMHCKLCLDELTKSQLGHDMSPQDYGSLEVGFTDIGVQVWCKRHKVNVVHIDFQGQTHPANSRLY